MITIFNPSTVNAHYDRPQKSSEEGLLYSKSVLSKITAAVYCEMADFRIYTTIRLEGHYNNDENIEI